ncbi:MAG: acyl-CoA thioesterase [Planctomycetes bacterium]|nr:acyl-CoA thioesterase [Planctomycetota bacterium]
MIDPPPVHAFCLEVHVDASHIDPQGHASNVCIVSWMNEAAWRHSVALGFDTPAYERVGGMFVVRRHEINYHHPAYLGDVLSCYTWPSDMAKATAERRHRIVRRSDGLLIADGLNMWAYLDRKTLRPTRIPPEVRAAFDAAKFKR